MPASPTLSPQIIQSRLERILPTVRRPGRYTGGEINQVVKDWARIATKVAFVFPDIYDLGMSNLGLAILYDQVNRRSDALAERAYAPWPDMEAAMRQANIPLYSLETKHALIDFDIIGFTLPSETLYTNVLTVLDLAGIPLLSEDRDASHPLIIAGGHATFNPEPMATFIDAFVIGEGEDVIHEIIETYQAWQRAGTGREDLLDRLSHLWGVYVPSRYRAHYDAEGNFLGTEPVAEGVPRQVLKRIVPELPPPPTRLIVPYIDTVHNRLAIEIMRGCTRGCRYCQAGMVTRPIRERSVEEVVTAIEEGLAATGFDEVGLLSLSSTDYTHALELVQEVNRRFSQRGISISLPSSRIETVTVELMDALELTRRNGFTLAPEAGSERLRNIINKPIPTDHLLDIAGEIYSRGWTRIKLYFMIGLPHETMDDVQAIADLAHAALREGRKRIGKRAHVHVGVSTFVPKVNTPFQWAPADTEESIRAKQALLRRALRGRGFKLSLNHPHETLLEAWLSRGDRRMSEVIYRAWQRGAKFDAWREHFVYDYWLEAFRDAGLSPWDVVHRPIPLDAPLPWEHISPVVSKRFLALDYRWSEEGRAREDCRHQCYACGILPKFNDIRRAHPGDVWKCPEVKPRRTKARKTQPTFVMPSTD